ncbi:universal stress protein [Actinomycetospora sp. C-140]
MLRRVVVGVGIEPDERTVRWAATEARDRGLGLVLVHALVGPVGHHPGWARIAGPALRRRGRQALADAAGIAHEVAPDLEITRSAADGGPVPVLRSHLEHAEMVVVGSDGYGRLGDLLLGGVARGLVGRVDVPVAVVPADFDPVAPHGDHAPVLLGDDGTPGCAGAWRFAEDRARRRGAPLVAVRVAADGPVDRALVDRARGADVLVLGVADPWFHHSAAPGVVRHATCPVIIVPPTPPRIGAGVPARGADVGAS